MMELERVRKLVAFCQEMGIKSVTVDGVSVELWQALAQIPDQEGPEPTLSQAMPPDHVLMQYSTGADLLDEAQADAPDLE